MSLSLAELRKDYKIGPFPAVDLIGTFTMGYVLYRYKIFSDNLLINELCIFSIGILTHFILGIKTPLNNMIESAIIENNLIS